MYKLTNSETVIRITGGACITTDPATIDPVEKLRALLADNLDVAAIL